MYAILLMSTNVGFHTQDVERSQHPPQFQDVPVVDRTHLQPQGKCTLYHDELFCLWEKL